MKDRFGNLAVWGIGSILLLWFDQYTKLAATISLKGKAPRVLVDGVFELLYSENRGAAFGILQGRQGFFFVIALAVLVTAGFMMYRMPSWKNARYHALKICLIFITAGAIGNMADRISLGYVVDFLYFSLIDFPIFNVADIYVSVGTAVLIILILFYYKEEELNLLLKGRKGDKKS